MFGVLKSEFLAKVFRGEAGYHLPPTLRSCRECTAYLLLGLPSKFFREKLRGGCWKSPPPAGLEGGGEPLSGGGVGVPLSRMQAIEAVNKAKALLEIA